MKVRLVEEWRHHITNDISDKFHAAIDGGDREKIRVVAKELLNKAKEFFNPEEQDYVIDEIDEIIESFDNLDTGEGSSDEDWDYILSELYDFCDGYKIFIDL